MYRRDPFIAHAAAGIARLLLLLLLLLCFPFPLFFPSDESHTREEDSRVLSHPQSGVIYSVLLLLFITTRGD